jgi:hypothetical protein
MYMGWNFLMHPEAKTINIYDTVVEWRVLIIYSINCNAGKFPVYLCMHMYCVLVYTVCIMLPCEGFMSIITQDISTDAV